MRYVQRFFVEGVGATSCGECSGIGVSCGARRVGGDIVKVLSGTSNGENNATSQGGDMGKKLWVVMYSVEGKNFGCGKTG